MSAAALIAAFGMAQAAPAPAPSPLFAAFKAACFNLKSADGESAFDKVGPAAKAAGWTEVTEADADPRIAGIIAKGRTAMQQEEPEAKVAGQLFRHSFDGRTVWLVTSRFVSKEGYWGDGCRAYDLDLPAAPPREVIDGWVGKAPTGVQANGTATKRLWEPWQTGVSLEITYVPRDHPLGTSYGIQGLVLVSQSIGGF
ncbi:MULTISPECIES: hypothetical protein [unclassified Sphingomonas]|uniref:hypothetical protein n=1 Tax=unclassified Sphingomonas TaxID=196159 RepID=UPI002151BC17|nr:MULTISPECIES: hypothetical protein [unclassified Sphingomonas]MCR5869761.1 hypothetical protein [Sphingomonas sp. J344]UUX98537.1 hypothetical protein LRS08_13370 [Sphingomonas sp. J315]